MSSGELTGIKIYTPPLLSEDQPNNVAEYKDSAGVYEDYDHLPEDKDSCGKTAAKVTARVGITLGSIISGLLWRCSLFQLMLKILLQRA